MATLSSLDLARLTRLQRLLLSPLDHPDMDEWRREVCRGAKTLLDADKASIALPVPNPTRVYFSEDLGPEVIEAYAEVGTVLERDWSAFERGCELGAYSRDELFRPVLDAFYRSEYYNEFVVPARVYDAVGLSVPVGDELGPRTVAHLLLHHDRPSGRRFSDREMALLQLLFPAFEGGVKILAQLGRCRQGLAAALDVVQGGVSLSDGAGRVEHENVSLASMLAHEPDASLVRGEICGVASATGRLGSSTSVPISGPREVRTARARYRLRGALVDPALLGGGGGGVLVSVERVGLMMPSDEVLRQRFGLTRKEAMVARLMAEGKTNRAIAESLWVSPHTARHHTENVMRKLDVRSRAEVAGRILE